MRDQLDVAEVYGPDDLTKMQAAYNFVVKLLSKKRVVRPDEKNSIANLVLRVAGDKTLSCDHIIARCVTQLGFFICADPRLNAARQSSFARLS
jgi:hypothetical protein